MNPLTQISRVATVPTVKRETHHECKSDGPSRFPQLLVEGVNTHLY